MAIKRKKHTPGLSRKINRRELKQLKARERQAARKITGETER